MILIIFCSLFDLVEDPHELHMVLKSIKKELTKLGTKAAHQQRRSASATHLVSLARFFVCTCV